MAQIPCCCTCGKGIVDTIQDLMNRAVSYCERAVHRINASFERDILYRTAPPPRIPAICCVIWVERSVESLPDNSKRFLIKVYIMTDHVITHRWAHSADARRVCWSSFHGKQLLVCVFHFMFQPQMLWRYLGTHWLHVLCFHVKLEWWPRRNLYFVNFMSPVRG
jgi:hypothetical protein